MNCYLPWNLKDMTNISAEKLQKNISQQASYIQLYRSELTKEAYKFNIGSLLRHICTERASFGNEPIQKRATDCLIIFLHAAAFQKVTYFAPTDAENPAVAKCARNLHRLMLENVKSTMRFIDYEVLQKHARGEIDTAELFPERQRIHNSVFPDEELITLSHNESLNDGFLKLIDMETQKARTFVDFDVQRNSDIPTDLCQKLAKVPRSEASLPESRYGLIGSCRSSLETPFIRYGNSYYSFVTAYSLNAIAPIVDKFAHEMPVVTIQEPEPISEPEAEPETQPEQEEEPEQETAPAEEPIEPEAEEEPVGEPEVEAEPEVVEEPEEAAESEDIEEPVETEETVEEEEEESEQEEPADSPEIAETEEPEESAEPAEDEDDEIPFDEPTETYFEPEVSEASEEEEEDDESDSSELEEFRNDAPVIEESPSEEDQEEENPEDDPFEDDLVEEEDYTALVSPDTYDYLNQTKSSEFAEDPMLEEQDQETCYDDEDEEEDQETSEEDDEPDPYRGESLFSIMDDSDEEEPVQEEPEEEKQEEQEAPIQPQSYPEDEEEPVEEKPLEQEAPQEPEPEAEPQEESEVREEPEPEAQPEEEHEEEPQSAPVEDQTLPLLDQILRCAPSKNNPIVQYLANCPFEQKKEIIRFIELARKAWLIDGKDKMFTIPDTSISVAVFSETQDPMLNIQRRENIGAVMYASQKDSWNSLEISYDSSGQFVKADYVRISRNSFTDWEWKIVEKLGTRLMERRAK